ncbi:MAG: protein kinase [Acidobacteriota bacterium]
MTSDGPPHPSDSLAGARARHRRLLEIFWDCCELPPDEREAVIDAGCEGDHALRDEVKAMLATHDEEDDAFLVSGELGEKVKEQAEAVLVAETSRPSHWPERIGRHRIVGLLGEGGMGTVYEAEQERPLRRVALKVLRSSFGSPDLLERFEREVQLLGRLSHPGIASVYEADWTEGDHAQPYFAMELVAGKPLDEHAAETSLDIRARLELLAQLCDAVQHAHEAGIVHRDLKPSNILVTAVGEPKILDFGVARAVDAIAGLTHHLETSTGQLIGTLPYMSPEQASGRPGDIGLQSDVYSLGIVAFELLTGRHPQDLDGLSITEALRVIREDPLRRANHVDTTIPAAIDTILGKALETEVGRRYQSMADFGDDIRRFLRDEPIHARPPTIRHRARMLARRHRYLLRGAIAVLAVGLVASGWVLNSVRHERASRVAATLRAYEASLQAAQTALRDRDSALALQRLDEAPVVHRGWEWEHLRSRTDQRLLTLAGRRATRIWTRADGLGVIFTEEDGSGLGVFEWDAVRDAVTCLGAIDDQRPVSVAPAALTAVVELVAFREDEDWVDIVATGASEPHARAWRCGGPSGVPDQPRRIDGDLLFSDGGTWLWRDGVHVAGDTGRIERAKGISSDGTFVVGYRTSTFSAIDLVTDEVLHSMKAIHLRRTIPDYPVRPNSRQYYLATHAPALSLWEPDGTEPVRETPVAAAKVMSLGLSPSGSSIGVGALDGNVQVFTGDLTRELALRHAPTEDIDQLLFLDEQTLATRSRNGEVSLWDLSDETAPVLRGHESYVYDVDWSPDGRWIASCAWDGTVRTWNAATGLEHAKWAVGHEDSRRIQALRHDQTGKRLLIGLGGTHKKSREQALLITLDATTLTPIATIEVAGCPESIEAHPDGGWLVDGREQTLHVAQDGQSVTEVNELEGTFGLAPDDDTVASARGKTDISIWSLTTGVETRQLPSERASYLAWSPDGSLLAASTNRGVIRAWDTTSWELVATLDSTSATVHDLRFHPDGTRLFAGDADGRLHVWETDGFAKRLTHRGHSNYIKALAFSPDGSELVTASGDGTLRIWSTDPIGERQLAKRMAMGGTAAEAPSPSLLNPTGSFTRRLEERKP